jgi:hypothetical protein
MLMIGTVLEVGRLRERKQQAESRRNPGKLIEHLGVAEGRVALRLVQIVLPPIDRGMRYANISGYLGEGDPGGEANGFRCAGSHEAAEAS